MGRKIAQIEKLGVRVYEYLAAVPLRRQGPPDPAVESGLRIIIGQPAAGSFRFGLRFAASEKQIALPGFEDTPPSASIAPKALGDAFVKIVQAAARPDEEERFESVVPVPDYRDAFFKLVRNLVPDGQDVREIELKRAADGRTVSRLIPATGKAITRHLQAKRAPRPEDEPSITDVLRGLQLNEGWIALGREPERRIYLAPDLAIEDVIGPLVNHPVTVAVHREHGRLFADDIEPAG